MLIFDLDKSRKLTTGEKEKIYKRWKLRVNEDGEIRICNVSQKTLELNKQHIIRKFELMISKALNG